jgi:hypothetical protein
MSSESIQQRMCMDAGVSQAMAAKHCMDTPSQTQKDVRDEHMSQHDQHHLL